MKPILRKLWGKTQQNRGVHASFATFADRTDCGTDWFSYIAAPTHSWTGNEIIERTWDSCSGPRLGETATTLACARAVTRQVIPIRSVHPKFLFGTGKVAELSGMVSASNADAVFVNAPLSRDQQKALTDSWGGATVVDRFRVILDIFADRARTKEAKLQARGSFHAPPCAYPSILEATNTDGARNPTPRARGCRGQALRKMATRAHAGQEQSRRWCLGMPVLLPSNSASSA